MIMTDSRDDVCNGLLVRVADGDRAALGELFASEAGRLIAIARRIVHRRELAEEVVQDAFVSVWQRAASFDPARGAARAWMTTIVRNRAINTIRDGARLEHMPDDELADHAQRTVEANGAFEVLPEGEALRQCLGRLDAARRKCILLAYVAGFSHGEIAAQLGAPVGTVKAWIRRGVVALQRCLS